MARLLKASQIVSVARRYKNYQEKRKMGTREQMWDFHWAPGSANYTIWAWLYKDYTNRNFQGQPWCAMYGSDVVVLAYMEYYGLSASEAIQEAKKLYGGDLPYNCQDFVNRHSGDKRLNHIPAAGCPVIFWTGAKYGHWGTCTGVDGNGKGFTSVEGNTSGGADKVDPDGGAVVEKWHSLDSRTLFWHPDFAEEEPASIPLYSVSCGKSGLRITGNLNIRKTAGNGQILGVYKAGEKVWAEQKCFIDGRAWYRTERGWISASYVEGWVLEDNGRWWYVMQGYKFSVNRWQEISGTWYYFDNTGYMVASEWVQSNGKHYYLMESGAMATSGYVKSLDKELYYWVNAQGEWEPEWDTSSPELQKFHLYK